MAATCCNQGDTVYCALSWSDKHEMPGRRDDGAWPRIDATVGFWRQLAGQRPHPRPRVPGGDPALGAGHQGPDLHADRGDRGRADHVAAGDAGRGTQLGLPLHLDAGLDVHPAGAALARRWTGRPTSSCSSSPTSNPTEDGSLQIMYGIDGRRDLTESSPRRSVRLRGRPAGPGRQRRVQPAAERRLRRRARLDPAAHPAQPAPARRLWPIVQSQAECATKVWQQPDQGIWEARGEPQHYVSSKLMCWVALDRAGSWPRSAGTPTCAQKWRADGRRDPRRHPRPRRQRRRACCASTTTPTRWTPRRCWPRFRVPRANRRPRCARPSTRSPTTSPRTASSCATAPTRPTTACRGKEGTFLICSFWLVSALAVVGETGPGPDLMERLLQHRVAARSLRRGVRHHTGRHLGNFPQAFSHLALIEAAGRIILTERIKELRSERRVRRHHHRHRRRRRHAGPPPGPVGQADPAARARRLAAPRAGRTGPPPTSSSTTATSRRTLDRRHGKAFQPQVHYFVGGATKLYGAALYRLRAEDFGELRHHDGLSPAWPISYDEMEPYYTRAEQLYQVHGARGEDPTEPPASAPYPYPPVSPRAAHPAALRRPGARPATTRSTRRAASC